MEQRLTAYEPCERPIVETAKNGVTIQLTKQGLLFHTNGHDKLAARLVKRGAVLEEEKLLLDFDAAEKMRLRLKKNPKAALRKPLRRILKRAVELRPSWSRRVDRNGECLRIGDKVVVTFYYDDLDGRDPAVVEYEFRGVSLDGRAYVSAFAGHYQHHLIPVSWKDMRRVDVAKRVRDEVAARKVKREERKVQEEVKNDPDPVKDFGLAVEAEPDASVTRKRRKLRRRRGAVTA